MRRLSSAGGYGFNTRSEYEVRSRPPEPGVAERLGVAQNHAEPYRGAPGIVAGTEVRLPEYERRRRREMAEVIPYIVLILTAIVPFALILVGISGE